MTDPHDHPTPVIAYFECFSGASGDMILGALVDAGWPIHALRDALEAMPLDGWELDVSATKKGALRATKVTIRVTAPQPERSVLEIVPMIKASRLSDTVKARAIALFRELADVEALQHADEPDNVHFHEVGAVDSILDIVGSVAGLEALGVTTVRVSPVNVGGGLVNSRDGILPVPGPATLELLRRRGIPMYSSEYGPEFLTPTGALVLGCLADSAGPFPPMTVERIGYGAGQKDFRIPNVLRVSIGRALPGPDPIGRVRAALAADPTSTNSPAHDHATHDHDHATHDHATHDHDHDHTTDQVLPRPRIHAALTIGAHADTYLEDEVVQIETNVDDMSGEWFGYLAETLMAKGALDVTMIPATMKKGRPGTLVSVLVRSDRTDDAVATLFRETTTLGLRIRPTRRLMLHRRTDTVQTPYGPIRVKVAMHGGSVRGAAPEYEDCRAAATRADVPLQAVMSAATDEWRRPDQRA
ncbi:MAG: nickel pincer cofactor biosynthesis protein LarC [Chloroflexota bacterium]